MVLVLEHGYHLLKLADEMLKRRVLGADAERSRQEA